MGQEARPVAPATLVAAAAALVAVVGLLEMGRLLITRTHQPQGVVEMAVTTAEVGGMVVVMAFT